MKTRREFLTDVAVVAASAPVAGCFPDVGGEWRKERAECSPPAEQGALVTPARVVEIFDEASVSTEPDVVIHEERVEQMLSTALAALTHDAPNPWRALLPEYAPGMRFGLKVNCLNAYCSTSVPFVKAVVESLKAHLEVTPDEVIVWDRRLDELTRYGYSEEALQAKVMGTVRSTTDPSGPGYEEEYCEVHYGKATQFSRILTELTDVTINCPVLKTHNLTGTTGALKNAYGVINNPGDFHDAFAEAVPAVYAREPIRRRFRVHLLDALCAVTAGGTSSEMDTVPKRVLAATDPVAMDAYALRLINQLRQEKPVPVKPVADRFIGWIENAGNLGLGTSEYELIKL